VTPIYSHGAASSPPWAPRARARTYSGWAVALVAGNANRPADVGRLAGGLSKKWMGDCASNGTATMKCRREVTNQRQASMAQIRRHFPQALPRR